MTGPLEGAAGQLQDLAELLGVSLGQWAYRDEARDKAAAREAGNTAVDTIDAMLARLHAARQQLVTEVRAADDAALARADELLRERRDGAR